MTSDKVVELRPGEPVENLIDDKYLETRIDELIRECDAVKLSIAVVVVKNGDPFIFPNATAFENVLELIGALASCQQSLNETEITWVTGDEGEGKC